MGANTSDYSIGIISQVNNTEVQKKNKSVRIPYHRKYCYEMTANNPTKRFLVVDLCPLMVYENVKHTEFLQTIMSFETKSGSWTKNI